jgi:ectoine hydroxylase-related dioxygenase (phytanoyl-CoA dioxygenase family)
MSANAPESASAVSPTAGRLQALVDADVGSIQAAVTARLTRLPARNERIQIDLGEGAGFVVDLAVGKVSDDVSLEAPPTVTLSTTPRLMAGILNGTRELRAALLFGLVKYKGKVESGVRLCDELAGKRFRRQDVFTDLPFPQPTTNRALARHQLREYGYCIISDALPEQQLKALQTRLDDQAAAERAAGIEYLEGCRAASKDRRGHRGDDEADEASTETAAPNQRVWLLHNKGDEFLDLLENPIISEFIPEYLDEDYPMAAQFSANIVGGGSEAQFLHQDQHPVQPATPFAIGVNTLFCLDDFTEANGATRLIPGSHIPERGLMPDNIYSTKGTVPAEAPAGSAILVDMRVWHGSGANRCSDPRRAVILLTQRSWARSVNNGVLSVHPSVLAKMSDRVKAMFGHRVTSGLGSIQTEPEGTIVGWNPDQLILEMHAEPPENQRSAVAPEMTLRISGNS